MNALKNLRFILNKKQKVKISILTVMIFIGTFLELIGVSAVLPFVEVMMNPEAIEKTWYLKWLYNQFKITSVSHFLILLALGLILIYIIKNTYLSFMHYVQYRITYNIQKDLANKLMTYYMQENYLFHLSKNSSELLRNVLNDTNIFTEFLNSIINFAIEILIAIILIIFLLIKDKSLVLGVVFVLGIFLIIFLKLFKLKMKTNGEKSREYYAKLLKNVQEGVNGIKEIKVLNRETYFVDHFSENYHSYIKSNRSTKILSIIPKYALESFMIIGLLMVVSLKLAKGIPAEYFVTTITVFGVAVIRLLPSINKIIAYINGISYSYPAVQSMYEDIKEIRSFNMDNNSEIKEIKFKSSIEIKQVSYEYPNTNNKRVLDQISLKIEKNKSVAFIGTSGSGKTTLADLILGVLQPVEGTVCVDGIDIQTALSGWQRKIGYIPQNIFLTDDTIRNNIALGIKRGEISEPAIWEALDKAQLKEFVEKLEDGLDTVIGERGVRISGGQRQRIGIARALYHNPELLVLDEATSALDGSTENAVMEAIDNLVGSKTLIIIAHRLSTIEKCDEVYRIENGTAVLEKRK